jgi:hypothetical protein
VCVCVLGGGGFRRREDCLGFLQVCDPMIPHVLFELISFHFFISSIKLGQLLIKKSLLSNVRMENQYPALPFFHTSYLFFLSNKNGGNFFVLISNRKFIKECRDGTQVDMMYIRETPK